MYENDVDWFIVFSQDEHLSEYTSESDRYLAALSGFTGSAGTLVVSSEEAYLWTDSRYWVQGSGQLEGSGITLMKQGMASVASVEDFLAAHIWDGQTLSFDLRTVSYSYYSKLTGRLPGSVYVTDGAEILRSSVEDMPKREFSGIVAVPVEKAGIITDDKLKALRDKIAKRYVSDESWTYILSDLTSIMWLFNLRGSDISYVPVAYSFARITAYGADIYLRRDRLSEDAKKALEESGIRIKEYSQFYTDLSDIATDIVLADRYYNNAKILQAFDEEGLLTDCSDPYLIPKAYKNGAERTGMISAHFRDAAVMIRFIRYVKDLAAKGELPDEYDLGKELDRRRIESGCKMLSFKTICAYGSDSAIVHFIAHKETAKKIKPRGFLLVDSGGQFEFEGTTDITRTISLGNVTAEEKKVYTTVLKGHLRLMNAVFPQGFKGALLDGIAETPLWSKGYFCGHGIGHGVGCYLSVHESEARIGRSSSEREVAFFPGVVVSDEPGIYLEGKFGVRIENLLLCEKAESIDGYEMCRFAPLTLVPYDKESIDLELLDEKERAVLDDYNKLIMEKISPDLSDDEKQWLKEYTDL